MIEDAMRAAPALFASPGDLFTWRGEQDFGHDRVEYKGRNENVSDGTSPKRGWLIFHNHGGGFAVDNFLRV